MTGNLCPWGRGYWKEQADHGGSRLHFYLIRDDDRLKRSYAVLGEALASGRPSTVLGGISDARTAENLIKAVIYDNPLLCEFSTSNCYRFNRTYNTITVSIVRNYSRDDYLRNMRTVEGIVKRIKDDTSSMSDYEKELYVYDYMVSNTVYDLVAPHQFDMFGALVDRRATCQGISSAVSYLLNRLGIDCSTVCGGVMGKSTGHAWNVVNLDGRNYNLDVTFELNRSVRSVHAYFNVNDACITDCKHMSNQMIHCRSMDMNYHRMKGVAVDDKKDIGRILRESLVSNNGRCAELRLSLELIPSVDSSYVVNEFKKALMCVRPLCMRYSYYELNGCYYFETR